MSSKVEIPREIALAFGRSHVTGRDMSDGVMAYMGTKLSWSLSQGGVITSEALGQIIVRPNFRTDAFITGGGEVLSIFELHVRGEWPFSMPLAAITPPLDIDMRAVQRDAIVARLDDKAVAKAAADFYLKRGHVNFAYAGAFVADSELPNNKSEELRDRIRCEAFANLIAKSKHKCFDFAPPSDGNREKVEKDLTAWLKSLPKPCAVFAYSDKVGAIIATVCKTLGIKVPDQICILGVDNDDSVCNSIHPSLSSIHPDHFGGGKLVAEQIDLRLSGRKTGPVEIRYGVKGIAERSSTLDLRGGGRLVASAMEIVTREACTGVTVSEIAARLGCSSRLLELRFHEILGHGIKDEMLRFRLENVRHLLATTNRAIDDITRASGWKNAVPLKILFKKRFGMSMRDWRETQHGSATATLS